jgi:hypothetical protein
VFDCFWCLCWNILGFKKQSLKYMGLFDFVTDVTSAVVKVALTPIAVAKDAVNVVTGEEADATKELLKSAGDDLESAGERAMGEK